MSEWLSERAAAAERETGTTFDLTACVREPIHRLGGVQSHGALIAVRAGTIEVTSANAESLLGVDGLLGAPVERLLDGEQLARLHALADADTGQTAMMPVRLAPDGRRFDVTVHRAEERLVLEFENAAGAVDEFGAFSVPVRQALIRLQRAGTVTEATRAAVREIRAITGYDRVVTYRFESADGPGEVIAEDVVEDWEPWLGLWFPATDIPPQARKLYERNWIRVIADVADATARLVPDVLPDTGEPLDLSLSVLRTVSPFHLEYLRNIAVSSSMSVSLLDDGRLWGLIACHGRTVTALSPPVRAACEFFGVALSLHLAALRERDESAVRERSRITIARLLERTSVDLTAGWSPAGLDQVVECAAVAVRFGGVITVAGPVPAAAVAELLAGVPAGELWHSDRLGSEQLSGALVLPVGTSGDCVVWLRGERTVARRWAADPATPVVLGPNGRRLTPRGSTAVFLATVRGRSMPWSATDLAMAAELGRSLTEIALAQARKLAALNVELTRSNVDLNSFAHAAAHDLKEPLRGIANYATFIAEDTEGRLDELTQRRLESIQRLATRMDELLNALLYYSRLGRVDLRREAVDLRTAVARALESAGPRLETAGVQVEVPGDPPPVVADPVFLDEILVNLLVNAAKYARADPPRLVSIGVAATVPPGGADPEPALFVRDNGIGMPEHLREEAFELFRRLHPGGQDGSGAGLAIVRRIVERHGGQIWAGESPGGGTTMWATFGRDRQ
ncbi:ATP-binding protein [Actinoplanes palleronii]|uniref:Sensor-like histidine kinase SenX3 n=1 Tax=Actinoplanes palleronii TaxID=113570 RepID=A0ABQ4BIG6_9ACTN|nr:ATP-binding protein [Actinoplanes palleronii]GIE70457.1 bacteriophytochrome [Actinoplanes palleronii]